MANFERAFYEDNFGVVHPMRMTTAYFNVVSGIMPAGPAESSIPAKISKGNREFGLRPRGVRLARDVGGDEGTTTKYTFLPVPVASAWGTTPYVDGGAVTINAVQWLVVGLVEEDYK